MFFRRGGGGAAAGSVSGPGSSTDNAIARWDGTGGATLQNSGVTIDDSNNVTTGAGIFATGGITIGAGQSGARVGAGNEVLMASDFVFSWGTTNWGTARQLNLSKAGAGVLSLDSGTAGDGLGKLKLGGMRFVGYTSSASGASTTELPDDKDCSIHKNTTTGIKSLAFNDGGSIVSVAMV